MLLLSKIIASQTLYSALSNGILICNYSHFGRHLTSYWRKVCILMVISWQCRSLFHSLDISLLSHGFVCVCVCIWLLCVFDCCVSKLHEFQVKICDLWYAHCSLHIFFLFNWFLWMLTLLKCSIFNQDVNFESVRM